MDDTNSPDIPPANESNIAIYGGIYRDAWMHITGPILIPDGGVSITTPKVSQAESMVRVTTEVRNALDSPANIRVTSEVIAQSGRVVATVEQEKTIAANSTVQFEPPVLSVTGAELWSPNHPNLYTLRSRVSRDGAPADEVSTPFGIRVMGYVPGKGYTINGEFINIHGVDRRQDYGYLGDALPDAISRRDMEIIKQLGANMVRTAHYIQDKSIVEAADELGLLVWEEIPNIKIYDYQPGPMTELGDSRYTRQYIDNCLAAMEEMIRRDRNHPSIIIWGIADDNTGYPYIQDQREMVDKAHELDPTRWTAGRVNPTLTDVRDPTNNAFYNFQKLSAQHPDWMWLWNEWGAFKNERGLDIEPQGRDRPENGVGIVSEYRRQTMPSEMTGAIAQEASWIKFEAMPWMASAKWEMFDAGCAACDGTKGIFDYYGPPEPRPWGTHFNGGDYRGLSDLWRIPKASFWFVKAQWTDDPFVQIVGHWTWPRAGEETKDDPRLLHLRRSRALPEREIARQAQAGIDGKPVGGMEELRRVGAVPFPAARSPLCGTARSFGGTFPTTPGTLRAVGVKNGKQYVDQRKTAGEPYQIVLQPDRASIAADGRDTVRIVAVIVDKDGVPSRAPCPGSHFTLTGRDGCLARRCSTQCGEWLRST